jgi:uncharacterized repeat protein (TIGR01451 family)
VTNRASVQYDVGGVGQEVIESSPTGNSTPGAGAGADTTFVVDNMVNLTVVELDSAATSVNPGQGDAVTAFTVTNTGNTTQDYALTASNLTSADPAVHGNADTDLQASNLRIYVDANANDVYDPATDTATAIDSLPADTSVTVFVVADVPIGAVDSDVANLRLTVVTHDAGTGATSLTVQTAGGDTVGVDVVFADAGRDGSEADDDGYVVSSAELTITKTSTVLSDPFNLAADPKAIPGALMEYSVSLNNGGSVDATDVVVTDVLNGDLTLATGGYNGGTADVAIEIGAGPAATLFCTADAGDLDGDGCGLTGGTLQVGIAPLSLTVGTGAATNPVRVLFRATID